MKYYEVICFTPYCGEQEYFYLEIPDYEDIGDNKWCAEVDNLIMENAYVKLVIQDQIAPLKHVSIIALVMVNV